LKRAITGIVAAGIALGTMAPAAFAATSGPNYNSRTITMGSYSANVSGIAAKDGGNYTEFIPVWYLMQGLQSLGYTVSWHGGQQRLDITTPAGTTPSVTPVVPKAGDTVIYVNGTPVQNAAKALVAKDPASGKNTSFLPIYYFKAVLNQLGFTYSYDGKTWAEKPAAQATLAIKGNSNISVGGKDSLTLTSTDAAGTTTTVSGSDVVWSVDGNGNAFIDASGNFTATATGTYNITASYKGQTVKGTVAVYGQAAGVKLSTPANLVANDASETPVTVTVVDSNGNPVSNFNGTVDLSITSNGAARLVGSSTTDYNSGVVQLNGVTVTDGQATVQLVGGGVPSLSDTITAQNVMATGAASALTGVSATTTVSTVAQVATSIKVTSPTTIGTNVGNETATVSAQVVDQTGNPMLSGVYPLTFGLNGNSTTFLVSGTATTAAQTEVEVGTGSASVTLQSVKGMLGTTTIQVTGNGLASGSANITGVSVGNAAKLGLAVDSNSSASFAEGNDAVLDPTLEDASGNAVTGTLPGTVDVLVTDSSGNPTTALTINNNTVNSSGEIAVPAGSSFAVRATGAAAGTYNIQLVDTATTSPLMSSPTIQLTVTPGAADHITLSAAQAFEAASNTADTFTAQVVDAFGNPVADSGVPVQFYATRTSGSLGTAQLNGVTQDGTSTTAVVYGSTNSNGTATVTLQPQTYSATWTVFATPSGLNSNTAAHDSETVAPTLTQKIGVNLTNNQSGSHYNGTASFNAGDSMSLSFSQLDQYGNPLTSAENDTLAVTFSNAASLIGLPSASTSDLTVTTTGNSETVTGTVYALNHDLTGLKAGVAGPFNVSAVDSSVSSAQSGSASGYVFANSTASAIAAIVPSAGDTVSTAGEYGPITIQLQDAGGNPAPDTTDYVLSYSKLQSLLAGQSGSASTVTLGVYGFRTSANGADVSSYTIPAGTTSVQVWVSVTGTGTIYASAPQTP
jgi:protocatechuate 3,4-dioxygenase beta subunit